MKEPKCYLSQYPRMVATPEWIEKNKLQLSRTPETIARRWQGVQGFLSFEREVLIHYVEWQRIKDDLVDEIRTKLEAGEQEWTVIQDINETAQDFLDYMNFAWGKAEDERGISASRSVDKLGEWLWLMDREDLSEMIHDDDLYNPYGAPALIAVCDALELPVPNSLREFAKHKC